MLMVSFRTGASASRTTSRSSRRSWPPIGPTTSPAPRSSSMAAWPVPLDSPPEG